MDELQDEYLHVKSVFNVYFFIFIGFWLLLSIFMLGVLFFYLYGDLSSNALTISLFEKSSFCNIFQFQADVRGKKGCI